MKQVTLREGTAHLVSDWHAAMGTAVEIRRNGVVLHRGFVDEVWFDGSAIWLSAYGISLRVHVRKQDDIELWSVDTN